jgi:integrase
MASRPKKVRTSKNLIVRGDMYYFRKTIDGKPKVISTDIRIGGTPEFEMAEKRARQIELEIHEGRFSFKKKVEKSMLVGAWCKTFVEACSVGRAQSTQDNIRYNAHHMCSTPVNGVTWELRDLRSITTNDCKALMAALAHGTLKASNSRRTFHGIAGAIFQAAIVERFLEENPWKFKRLKAIARDRVLSHQEQAVLWPHLLPYYQRLATFGIYAGLRAECELARLKEGDFDFVRQQIHVRRGKGSKERFVPMAREVAVAAREQLEANKMGCPGTPKQSPRQWKQLEAGYVFTTTNRTVLKVWEDSAELAGIPHFTSHDLRRTFGTRCADAGVPMKKLQTWMGHTDISITAQFYVHLNSDGDAQLMERMLQQSREATKADGQDATGDVIPFQKSANS